MLFYGKQRASGGIPHNKLKKDDAKARGLAEHVWKRAGANDGRLRARGARGRGRARGRTGGRAGGLTPLGCSCPPTSRSTERVDGRAIGVSVRKALFELGRVILAQQINPLTQKTPKEEAEHCLSNYRGSLQK